MFRTNEETTKSNLEFRRHVQKRYNEELHPVFERPPHSETSLRLLSKNNREVFKCATRW